MRRRTLTKKREKRGRKKTLDSVEETEQGGAGKKQKENSKKNSNWIVGGTELVRSFEQADKTDLAGVLMGGKRTTLLIGTLEGEFVRKETTERRLKRGKEK